MTCRPPRWWAPTGPSTGCACRRSTPACFAALLDSPEAGHWRVAPEGGSVCTSRRYVDETVVLETTWTTPEGSVRVTDFMPPRGHAPDVVRIVEGVTGIVPMRSELRLRFDYGRVVAWQRRHAGRIEAIAGPDRVQLHTPAPMVGEGWATVSQFVVRPGDRVPFVLTWNPSHQPPARRIEPHDALRDTLDFWRAWSRRGNDLPGPYHPASPTRRRLQQGAEPPSRALPPAPYQPQRQCRIMKNLTTITRIMPRTGH